MTDLKKKLEQRDVESLQRLIAVKHLEPHPVFSMVSGAIENWERVEISSSSASAKRQRNR